MKIVLWLNGYKCMRVTGMMLPQFITLAANAGLPMHDWKQTDEFTAEFLVPRWAEAYLQPVAARCICELSCTAEYGFPVMLRRWRSHKTLAVLLPLAILLPIWLSGRIWFYEVEGNETVPSQAIVRAVTENGVPLGAKADRIDPQMVKTKVMLMLPKLEWLTVVHRGCRAIISVRERTRVAPSQKENYGDLIAVRDGVVTSIRTLEGYAAVHVGQSVEQGEVLISGEIPLERTTRICKPKGEVYARTLREEVWTTPKTVWEKCGQEKPFRNVFLIVQKKRIKIFSNSGNLQGKCDKMTKTESVALAEGWDLPIRLSVETVQPYHTTEAAVSGSYAEKLMTSAAIRATGRSMIDGKILRIRSRCVPEGDHYTAELKLETNEMIARQSNSRYSR